MIYSVGTMSRPLENNHPSGAGISTPLQPGLVQNVCRQWLVHEDAALASCLQDNEFASKYNRNCEERRLARQDVPLARQVQGADEEFVMNARQRNLQRMQDIADEDALVAEQLLSEEFIRKEQERVMSEHKDEEMARHLQEKERKRYELRLKEKELRRQRKMLEAELKRESDNLMENNLTPGVSSMSISACARERLLSLDGRVEGHDDFYVPAFENLSDRDRKELQRLQDEELARRLQDQEHKRGNKDKLKEIEMRDAELAKIMQEQEHLRQQKRRRHHRHRDARQSSDPCHSVEPTSVAEARHSYSLPQSHDDHHPRGHQLYNSDDFLPQRNVQPHQQGNSNYVNEGIAPIRLQPSQGLKFASRPLPDTPSPELPRGCNMSLLRALDRNTEQETSRILATSVPTGVQAPCVRDARRAPLVLSDDDEDFLPPPMSKAPRVPKSTSTNIFAAIDPTWSQDKECLPQFTSSSSTDRPSAQGLANFEDGYCDLEDIRALRMLQNDPEQELEVVPGQRRQPLNRDNRRASGRKANCKQQ